VIGKETEPMFRALQNFFLPPPNPYLAYNSGEVHNTAWVSKITCFPHAQW